MSILSTNTRLINVGQDYSAGSGISIDDGVISVTGEFGKTYSAGNNVDIYEQDEQLYISSKDWTNDIANASANAYNEAVAQIPDPFDPSYLSAQIDNKLNSSDFTTWQNGQYTTDLQTIEGQINNKLDTSSFSDVSGSFLTAINIPESATWNEVSQAYEQASGTYLTSHQSLDGYATEQWVEDKGYLTGVSIPESAVWQDVSTTVQTNSAQWAEGGTGGDEEVNSFVYENSASITDVNSSYKTYSSTFLTALPSDLATTGDLDSLSTSIAETYYPYSNPSSFVNEDWVTAQGYITGVDLSEYAKRDFVLSSIESATSSKLDVSSFAGVSGDFLVASSLNGYATESFVENVSGDITALIPDTSNFITNSSAESTYQTIDGMTAYQPTGAYITLNDLHFIEV